MFGFKTCSERLKMEIQTRVKVKMDYDVNVWSQKKIKIGHNGISAKRSKWSSIFMFGFNKKSLSKDQHGSNRGKPPYCDRNIDLITGAVDTFQVAGVTQGRRGLP